MSESSTTFAEAFEALTGQEPLSWQTRLFNEFKEPAHQQRNVIDLPTGMGKTMVMAIWLIARAQHPGKVPTRLIYVVDRRTVVDQATDKAEEFAYLLAPDGEDEPRKIAERKPELIERKKKYADALAPLRDKLGNIGLAISTLRGQLADNREWSRDPSRPAMIIGTVDLIGSALLFSGYRSSSKRRPLEAGLLGQDSLLVLDEAHLSKPFEQLLVGRKNEGGRREHGIEQFQAENGTPMRVIRMSATSGDSTESKPPFTLQFDANGNLTGEDAKDNTIADRFGAKKTLSVETKKPIEAIAAELAIKKPGSRIVIFVQTPKQVDDVRKALEKKNKDYATCIAQLTGTMRGLERDELVTPPTRDDQHERRAMQRFLKPDNAPSLGVCFLISTSAGEVGFDLNADHLVGDAAPLDSWMQRLGRVNRRGGGDATIVLVRETKPADKTEFDKACIATSNLLTDGMDVSPKALTAFRKSLPPEQIEQASSPKPAMVELTDILLDAWSMTSITEPMPGRPEVGPWLRGIAEWEPPQTTIAWRAELDQPGVDQLDLETIEEWFDTHRVLTHETLSVPTSVAAKTILARWFAINEQEQSRIGKSTVIVDRAGFKIPSISEFIKALQRDDRQSGKTYDSIRNADLILPASFGGIERGKGLLDADAPGIPKDEDKKPIEEQQSARTTRRDAPDVADIAPGRQRRREIITKTEDGDPGTCPIGLGTKPTNPSRFTVELESGDDDKRVQLVSYVRKQEKPEWGSKEQTLGEHVGRVRKRLDKILARLDLTGPIMLAAQLAADYHDHGKNRERWQRCVGGRATPPGEKWRDETLGKSGAEMKRDPRGYRHEFGSLRDFLDAHPDKIDPNVLDLALHLIASHHGRGRPHFPKGGFDPDAESRSPEIHTDAIRRFARLQRKYGRWGLAYLESLLRAADWAASAGLETDDDTETLNGADA